MTKNKGDSPKVDFEYEFGGPIGAAATTLILPVVVLWLAHCSRVGYADFSCFRELFVNDAKTQLWDAVLQSPVFCPSCTRNSDNDDNWRVLLQCTAAVLAWFLFQVALERCSPCTLVEGAPIVSKNSTFKLSYRINGHLAFWVTLLIALTGWPVWDKASETIQFTGFPHWNLLYEYFGELALVSTVLCFAVNTWLYMDSFQKDRILAVGGNSGSFTYDFFIGRELKYVFTIPSAFRAQQSLILCISRPASTHRTKALGLEASTGKNFANCALA